MSIEELRRLLDARNPLVPGAASKIGEWQNAVASLCTDVEDWLGPLRADDRVAVDHRIDDTTEDDVGTYSTNGLALRFPGIPGEVTVRARSLSVVGVMLPNGTWHAGVRGRVDVAYGAIRLPVTRKRGGWMVGLDGELVEFTADSFGEALKTLLHL